MLVNTGVLKSNLILLQSIANKICIDLLIEFISVESSVEVNISGVEWYAGQGGGEKWKVG